MSRKKKKKDRGFLCEQSNPLWGWLSGYLQINRAVQSLLHEAVETSCFCLLSFTDFAKNVLLQNERLLNIFPNRKEICQRKIFKLFICWFCFFFFPFRSQSHKASMHQFSYAELSPGSPLFQEVLPKLGFICKQFLSFCSCYHYCGK